MSLSSILLRLLLCLSLLVNGVASAVAMPSMEAVAPDAHAMAAASSASATPCHEQGQAAIPHQGVKMLAHMHGKPQRQPKPDCCKSGACDCACTQLAQVFSVAPLVASVIPQATVLPPPEPQRAAPALPHLIRPPIG
ncbi:MAG: CopL family metal-binding regulatory protein [Proteobacteria bacterium]|nr:CopL family metal-binding regulatory protein [Pseudomonadota bacterium]MBS0598873.1 CopL family metal-binding regulatory protein [Pseudomonadota bacterium]